MSEQINNTAADSDEISLKELILNIKEWIQYLWSKVFIILAFGFLGGLIGYFYAFNKKPIYTAATTFVLENDKGGGLGQYSGLAAMAGIDLSSGGGGLFQGDNLLELYKSRSMIEKTLLSPINNKELLIDRYILMKELKESWAKNPKIGVIKFLKTDINKPSTRLKDSLLNTIVNDINKNYLNVSKPDKKLSIIQVEVKSEDELFAQLFNNQIVKNVNDFYLQTKTKKAIENVAMLQHKTDSVRMVLTGSIYRAAQVTDATPNLNPTRQTQRIAPVQTAQVSSETNKTILSQLIQNLELSKMNLQKETPLIEIIDAPILPLEKSKLGKSKAILIGGLGFGFITVLILLLRRLYKDIVNG